MSEKKYSDKISAGQLENELRRIKKRSFFGKSTEKKELPKRIELPKAPRIEKKDGRIVAAKSPPLSAEEKETGFIKTAKAENAFPAPNSRRVGFNIDVAIAVDNKTAESEKNQPEPSLEEEKTQKTDTPPVDPEKTDDARSEDETLISDTPNQSEQVVSAVSSDTTESEQPPETPHETSPETPQTAETKPSDDDKGNSDKDKGFAQQIEAEIDRVKHKREYGRMFRETIVILLGVAAVAVLVSMLFLPVLRVTGSSMEPTLSGDDIVVCSRYSKLEKGDIAAFYFNNKVLLKRVIGVAGDVIDISDDGTVTVNGTRIDEPYIKELSLGECDLEFPFQVPESRIFVMGDNRSTSVDSRSSAVGCIADEYIIGKVFWRAWPLGKLGTF